MIKISDYIVRRIAETGVKHVFMLTGGGAMHLNDSVGRSKDFQYICNHHEQACAMAVEGYARVTGNIGIAIVTTGPGGTNAITGVFGQWVDSIPALYISGQVRYDYTIAGMGLPLRQVGDQEGNIIEIVKPITKYAVMVTDPSTIRYHLEKALFLARSGRPGPVWLDIPLNVQASMVEEKELRPYDPEEDRIRLNQQRVEAQVSDILERIRSARRPVILGGAGIRLGGACDHFLAVCEKIGIPVLTAWDAIDLMASDHPLFFGRPSTLGQRGANFIFQNADLLLVIGCRMNVRQIGYNSPSVARAAVKIMVDIDSGELEKSTFKPDLPVVCDAGLFLKIMGNKLEKEAMPENREWLMWCKIRRDKFPVVLAEYRNAEGFVNPYFFCDILSDCLESDDMIVSSNGASCVIPIQTLRLKKGQRHIVNSGCAAMGYGLPAAIGACFARGKKRVICLEGDGSIQLNLQELQTVFHHQLPIKIFLFNNGGYLSIRTTQNAFFSGHLVGEGSSSGVSFPDALQIAAAFGIQGVRIQDHLQMKETIQNILQRPGPILCDVRMSPNQSFIPRVSSQRLPDGRMVSKPLEDMYPFLDREEFLKNMLIPPWDGA